MNAPSLVLLADPVEPFADNAALRALAAELDALYRDQRLAPFRVTSSGGLLGILEPVADPFRAVLATALRRASIAMCWRIDWTEDPTDGLADGAAGGSAVGGGSAVAGDSADGAAGGSAVGGGSAADHGSAPGDGSAAAGFPQPATAERLVIRTGDPGADSLLDDLVPTLLDRLDEMTDRQREIAGLAILDDLRQSEVAQQLGVARATVSISFDRAHVGSLRRLLRVMRRIAWAGWERQNAERAQRARGNR